MRWRVAKRAVLLASVLFLKALVAAQTPFVSGNYIPIPDLEHIYIRSNGAIEPSTAAIERIGNTYTFIQNIRNLSIRVERDNIVIDGAGHTLTGSKENGIQARGIYITDRSNVTIKNLKIQTFNFGIWGDHCWNNFIANNEITCVTTGIGLVYSHHICIEQNELARNEQGIILSASDNINITANNLIRNREGITSNINPGPINRISIQANNITSSSSAALTLLEAGETFVVGNNINDNTRGIYLRWSNVTFHHNNFINNKEDLYSFTQSGYAPPPIMVWDNGTAGNYWSNYTGRDDNEDGIGDTPYLIQVEGPFDDPTYINTARVRAEDKFPLISTVDIDNFKPLSELVSTFPSSTPTVQSTPSSSPSPWPYATLSPSESPYPSNSPTPPLTSTQSTTPYPAQTPETANSFPLVELLAGLVVLAVVSTAIVIYLKKYRRNQ
jgi:parallel beta-helix repeat protein